MLSCNIFQFFALSLYSPPAVLGCCFCGQNPDKLNNVSVSPRVGTQSVQVGGQVVGEGLGEGEGSGGVSGVWAKGGLYISGVPKSFRSLCLCRYNVYIC